MGKGKHKRKKKHVDSRATHFARFAARYWQQLEAALAIEGIRIDRYHNARPDEVVQSVLAKQLYDFADHVLMNHKFTFVKDIPDFDPKNL